MGAAACGSSSTKSTTSAAASVPATTSTATTKAATKKPSAQAHKSAPHKATKTTNGSTTTSHSTTTTHKSAGTTTSSPKPVTPQGPVGPLHATLSAQDHTPVVNKPWPYTVTATDGRGQPLSGTVDIEFVFGGQIVGRDTPPTRPITNGRWHDNLKFPPPSLGIPLIFRAVVHTQVGSMTLDWPVKAKR
jgi:hypothetical protein